MRKGQEREDKGAVLLAFLGDYPGMMEIVRKHLGLGSLEEASTLLGCFTIGHCI